MPPGGAPPGGGGDIANQLMQLVEPILQSPKGQMMVQALMSQMGGGGGGDPRAMMAQMGMGGGGGNPAAGGTGPGPRMSTDSDIMEMERANMGGRTDPRPPQEVDEYASGEPSRIPDPRQTPMPSTEDEMAMVQKAMNGGGGGGGMNADGPTPQEVQMLKSSPSPRNMQNFDKLFGPGAAQAALGGQGGAPPTGGSTYEQDVKGAMDDADGDEYQ